MSLVKVIRGGGRGLNSDLFFCIFVIYEANLIRFEMRKFWVWSISPSITIEHHLLLILKYEKNDRVVIQEVITTALKNHHYFIMKIINKPLKRTKDVWNIKILNVFNVRNQTNVAKTTCVVNFHSLLFSPYYLFLSFLKNVYVNSSYFNKIKGHKVFINFEYMIRDTW